MGITASATKAMAAILIWVGHVPRADTHVTTILAPIKVLAPTSPGTNKAAVMTAQRIPVAPIPVEAATVVDMVAMGSQTVVAAAAARLS